LRNVFLIEPHTAIGGFFVRQKEGDLDPKRYFGFHEILTEDGNSVVDWHNMLEESEIAAEEGDGDDE
jgi:hypothetical protein